ncbi:hypothetical protein SPILM97S_00229 [Streptomyces pilosus]
MERRQQTCGAFRQVARSALGYIALDALELPSAEDADPG